MGTLSKENNSVHCLPLFTVFMERKTSPHDGSSPFDTLRVPSPVEGRNRVLRETFLVKREPRNEKAEDAATLVSETSESKTKNASRFTNDDSYGRSAIAADVFINHAA